ncbi:hypothetical protein [Enhygromyxa salina]|uniref:Uncharacterized protein n=1 Tax=Enhygromyxa salina TaxID=215803 RepID=A0A2S9YR06_9BACT|nr:hypothetical protein [Enhygromyxa salina]PRQ07534.1 hypothetical protein ENSA7_27540 [Enhygromyxa salina]
MTHLKPLVVGALTLALALVWPTGSVHAGEGDEPTAPTARELAKRKQKLEFLDEAERTRVGQTAPFVVRTNAIAADTFASELSGMCGQVSGWQRPMPMTPERIIELLSERPLAKRMAAAKDADVVAIVTLARELADMFAGLDAICRRARSGKLESADLQLLRLDHASELDRGLAHASQIVEIAGSQLAELLEQARDYASAEALAAAKATLGPAAETFISKAQVETPGKSASALAVPSLGAIGQTAFEGLAEFLIDRAKEETLAYVQEQLVERICAPTADTRVFIPVTCDTLLSVGSTLSVAAIGASVHASIVRDLELLPDRALVLAWMTAPEVAYPGTLARVVIPLARAARARTNPADFAASLHASEELECETLAPPGHVTGDQNCADTMAVLRLASMLSYAIASNSSAVQKLHPAYLSVGVAFTLEQRFAELPVRAQQRILAQLGSTRFEIQPGQLEALTRAVVQLEDGIMALRKSIAERVSASAELGPILDADMYGFATIASKQLALTGHHALALLTVASPARSEEGPKPKPKPWTLTLAAELEHVHDYIELAHAYADEDWARAAIDTIQLTVALINARAPGKSTAFDQRMSGVRRYIPLFIELGNATSSDEVNLALQSAFPAGGFKRKYRQGAVSINGFLGVYAGATLSNELDANDQLAWGRTGGEFAMFAPIGVHATGPVGVGAKRPWHLGALISVVDLGAITTSKWLTQETSAPVDTSNGTSQTELGEPAAFNLAGLLSPGAYFTVGIANSPFVLGAGLSLNPFGHKRTITGRDSVGDIESVDKTLLPVLRFGAFLAVDITLVSFGLRCGVRCPKRR